MFWLRNKIIIFLVHTLKTKGLNVTISIGKVLCYVRSIDKKVLFTLAIISIVFKPEDFQCKLFGLCTKQKLNGIKMFLPSMHFSKTRWQWSDIFLLVLYKIVKHT